MTWYTVAATSDVMPGEVKACKAGDIPIAIYNVDGEFFATHNICTHAHACLSDGYMEDATIECPLHQGVFDIRTGKALSGPLTKDVQVFPVRAAEGEVSVEVA